MCYQFKQSIKYLIVIAIILNGCSTTEKPKEPISGGYSGLPTPIPRSKMKEILEITNLYTQKNYQKIYKKLEGYKNAKSDDLIKDLIREDSDMSFMFSVSAIYENDKPLFEYVYKIATIHEREKRTREKLDIFNEIKNSNWVNLVEVISCYLNNNQQKEMCKQKVNDEALKKLFDVVL